MYPITLALLSRSRGAQVALGGATPPCVGKTAAWLIRKRCGDPATQFLVESVFANDPVSALGQTVCLHVLRIIGRNDDDTGFRMIFADESHALETVEAGKLEVQQNKLGLSRSHHFQRLAAITDGAQNEQTRKSPDDPIKHFLIELAVVRDDNANPSVGL